MDFSYIYDKAKSNLKLCDGINRIGIPANCVWNPPHRCTDVRNLKGPQTIQSLLGCKLCHALLKDNRLES